MCARTAIPSGWVITAFTNSAECGGLRVDYYQHNAWRITLAAGKKALTQCITELGKTLPGWVVTGIDVLGDCGTPEISDPNNAYHIVPLATAPQTINVCRIDFAAAPPDGWVVVAFISNPACGRPVDFASGWTLRRL